MRNFHVIVMVQFSDNVLDVEQNVSIYKRPTQVHLSDA